MENQSDFQRYGTWYDRNVYKVTYADYIKFKYYEKAANSSSAFWIIDDNNYFVVDNTIRGKVITYLDRISVEERIKEAGSTYYWPLKTVKVKLVDTKTEETVMEWESADEMLYY